MSALARLSALALALLVLSGCGASLPFGPFADSEPVLKGTVSYRERIVLPPDAMLVVTLTDTTPVIVTTRIVAEAVVRVDGRSPPIPFELPYDRTRIASDRNYGVRAAISSGGRVLFETSGAHPVITHGNPKRVELDLVRGAAAAAVALPTLVVHAQRRDEPLRFATQRARTDEPDGPPRGRIHSEARQRGG